MHIVALLLAVIGSVISFLQGGCVMVCGGAGSQLAQGHQAGNEMAAVAGGGLFVMIAAIMALVGGILAVLHNKSAFIILLLSAVLCLLAGMTGFTDAYVYGGAYGVGALCAYMDAKKIKNKPTASE